MEFLSIKVIYKKDVFSFFYVFFDVESESELCLGRWPLVFEL